MVKSLFLKGGLKPVMGCFIILLTSLSICSAGLSAQETRETISFDENWSFALGHATDKDKDFGFAKGYFSYLAKTGYGDGPASAAFDDRSWRKLDLPHDWITELGFSNSGSHSHGYKKSGPGFPETSVGWYRKQFNIDESDLGRRIRIEFDGIYRDAAIFVNGFFLGQEPSGYASQSYDISEYLNYGGNNLIVVRVDASMEEGWYYEGAGIYQHVWLSKTDPVHVSRYGTSIVTRIDGSNSTLEITTEFESEDRESRSFKRHHTVIDPDGKKVATIKSSTFELQPGEVVSESASILVKNARLWSLDTPQLYTLLTELIGPKGETIDSYETNFGIREIHFDPNKGFFLNGKHVKLKGSNNHQDHAGVGVAVPDALVEFRLRKLKEMGNNAYRASHHPATPALLDACDRLGMLVIDENRLMGINDYHLDQLEHMIKRDRNHPSVILWSLGNEEWKIEGNIWGARIAQRMQDFARRLDPTRLNTVAISGGWGGIDTTMDVMGVNYIRHGDPDKQHKKYPNQIILGTEETTTQATRGIYFEDASKGHLPPQEDGSSNGNCELNWQYYSQRDYAAGVFWWTGFDYRGEPTPYGYPAICSQFGIMDTCGFPKDSFYYLQSWWQDEPVLHLFPHWNWPGREGEVMDVRVHSNCDEVELIQDGKSLGKQAMPDKGHLAWAVTYQPGELVANAYTDGKLILTKSVSTTTAAKSVDLIANKTTLLADNVDVSVITVRVLDAEGREVPVADNNIRFTLEGPGKILGVGNGNPSSHELDRFVQSISTLELGNWTAPDAADSETGVVYEAVFDRPEQESVELLLNALGTEQTVSLNGKILLEGVTPEEARTELILNTSDLLETGNTIKITATPYKDWGTREGLFQFHPASLKVIHPAPQFQRKLFNGLAQIIVQSGKEAGSMKLIAESAGVQTASIEIELINP